MSVTLLVSKLSVLVDSLSSPPAVFLMTFFDEVEGELGLPESPAFFCLDSTMVAAAPEHPVVTVTI